MLYLDPMKLAEQVVAEYVPDLPEARRLDLTEEIADVLSGYGFWREAFFAKYREAVGRNDEAR